MKKISDSSIDMGEFEIDDDIDEDSIDALKFWSSPERRPESIALDTWLDILEKTRNEAELLKNNNIFFRQNLVEETCPIVSRVFQSAPVCRAAFIQDFDTMSRSRARLLIQHEKEETSLTATSAIIERMRYIDSLLRRSRVEKSVEDFNLAFAAMGEPLEGFSCEAKQYAWLSRCGTVQDAVFNLWRDNLNRVVKLGHGSSPKDEISLLFPDNRGPKLYNRLSVEFAWPLSQEISLGDVIRAAIAAIPDISPFKSFMRGIDSGDNE